MKIVIVTFLLLLLFGCSRHGSTQWELTDYNGYNKYVAALRVEDLGGGTIRMFGPNGTSAVFTGVKSYRLVECGVLTWDRNDTP
jgi:hypothetical protein